MKERFIALEASAGSGKTFALAVRFVALILSKPAGAKYILNILAITFTNKAANEMKTRIIEAFLNLTNYQKDEKIKNQMDEICRLLGGVSPDEVLKRRDERLKYFLSTELRIYTFDAFFGSILRQFSLNAGLLPDFEIEQNQANFINENYIKSLGASGVYHLAQYICQAGFSSGARFLSSLAEFSGNDLEIAKSQKPDKNPLWACFAKLKNEALNKGYDKPQKLEISSLKELGDLLFAGEGYKQTNAFLAKNCPELLGEVIDEFRKFYKDFVPFKISSFLAQVKEYEKERKTTIKARNKLEFEDVNNFVYELLKKGEKKIHANELYFRLDGKITDILIDEFQDTNARQFEILYPLIDEIMAGFGQNDELGSFFYVGDIKQSIYAFRGGQKEIFAYLRDKCFLDAAKSRISSKQLEYNRRSDKLIVEFVNETFKEKIAEYKNQLIAKDDIGYIEVASYSALPKEMCFENFGALLLEKINLLKSKNVDDSDITILCWQNNDILEIKNFLKSQGLKVASKAKNLSEMSDVRLVIAYLELCLFAASKCENEPFKNSYFLNAKAYLEQFGKEAKPLKLNINEAENTLKFLAKKLEINEFSTNLLLLYEIAKNKSNIYEFLYDFYKDETKAVELEKSGINIMTVHSSKGLDFEHCILCDRFGRGNSDKSVFLSYYDLENKQWKITLNDENLSADRLNDENYKLIKQKLENIENDEKINRLYVALTRAKHSLIVLCKENGDGNNPSYFKPYGKEANCVLSLENQQKGQILSYKKDEIIESFEPLKPFEKVNRQELLDENKNQAPSVQPSKLSAIYFGKALHYAFEMSGDFSDFCVEQGVEASRNKYGYLLDIKAFLDIKARILSFAKLKEREFSGFKMYKEQEIIYDAKVLRLDLLLVNDENAIIIDYKSSFSAAINSAEQIKGYIKAINEIYAKPADAYFAIFEGNDCKLKSAN